MVLDRERLVFVGLAGQVLDDLFRFQVRHVTDLSHLLLNLQPPTSVGSAPSLLATRWRLLAGPSHLSANSIRFVPEPAVQQRSQRFTRSFTRLDQFVTAVTPSPSHAAK